MARTDRHALLPLWWNLFLYSFALVAHLKDYLTSRVFKLLGDVQEDRE